MLRFFRTLRQRLLAENRVSRYLLYAVGEIVLVVIGILIALQVNTWNEGQKERKIELKALMDLKREFLSNQALLEAAVRLKQQAFESNEAFLNTIGLDAPNTASLVRDYGGSTINPNNGVLNSLIATGTINVIQNDSLKHLLTSWGDLIQNYREEEERHYNWLDLIVWPYLNEVIPNSDYSTPGNWDFLDSAQVMAYYARAFQDMKFRNLHLENRKALAFVLGESRPVLACLYQILALLDTEIRKLSP